MLRKEQFRGARLGQAATPIGLMPYHRTEGGAQTPRDPSNRTATRATASGDFFRIRDPQLVDDGIADGLDDGRLIAAVADLCGEGNV